MRINEYSFNELIEDIDTNGESEERLFALAQWFSRYGSCFWNGECWKVDKRRCLFPIYSEPDESDCCEIIGAEMR